eukprot:TRINITY_DN45233_c0_g1_i1.p1 TRINITY_DN45233_c0_g1~~TRINITY_DN45233_c0_g1_i1.p1  ORF type:complete len:255 (-),score=43.40 TRINITY_DN45233_c0_g1_i1:90-854(-)
MGCRLCTRRRSSRMERQISASDPASAPSESSCRLCLRCCRAKKSPIQQEPVTKADLFRSACAKGKLPRVKKMVADASVDVNSGTARDYRPVHAAAAHGHLAVLKLLMEKTADINAPTKQGITPLHLAAAEGHVYVVEALLEARALPTSTVKSLPQLGREPTNRTPLDLAVGGGHDDVVKILRQAGHETAARKRAARGDGKKKRSRDSETSGSALSAATSQSSKSDGGQNAPSIDSISKSSENSENNIARQRKRP